MRKLGPETLNNVPQIIQYVLQGSSNFVFDSQSSALFLLLVILETDHGSLGDSDDSDLPLAAREHPLCVLGLIPNAVVQGDAPTLMNLLGSPHALRDPSQEQQFHKNVLTPLKDKGNLKELVHRRAGSLLCRPTRTRKPSKAEAGKPSFLLLASIPHHHHHQDH